MASFDDVIWTRWDEVDALFAAALDRLPGRRERFVAEACGEDRDLYRAVMSLVDDDATGEGESMGPGLHLLRDWAGSREEQGRGGKRRIGLCPGDRVGRYRIVGELGRGGMATVFEAERADGVYRQTVALKVLRTGLDTEETVRRFRTERDILSNLVHPNIAPLLDGGATEDGRPFLVMPRVDGKPVTLWADEQGLKVRERVRLFLQVADAVTFAHRRLVIHRDIKPSNVLVDAEGRAILLDFGIAKLLDPARAEGDPTRTGTLPLTPEYASPEQLRGDPVTTASDVYQLGVLLYVLLTGTRPFGSGDRDGVVIPTEREATPPSQAVGPGAPGTRRLLRGDLDTVILKAIRTEPEERYGSVKALTDDLRRHLFGRPVEARPPSAVYRVRKFVRRNPWFPPVAAAFVLALAAWVGTLELQSRRLERERNSARVEAERAEQLRTFLVDLFQASDPYRAPDPARSREITVVEALELGAERARSELEDWPTLRADLLASIGEVYERLDLREPALALFEESLHIRDGIGRGRSPEQIADLERMASVLTRAGRVDSARTVLERHLELAGELGRDRAKATGLLGLADNEMAAGEREAALEHREEAVAILRSLDEPAREELARALSALADSYRAFDRLEEADEVAREGLRTIRDLRGDEDPRTAEAQVHLAQLLHARGDVVGAVRTYREAIPKLEASLGPLHFITINTINNFGTVLSDAGDFAGAETIHRRVLERRRAVPGGDTLAVAGSLQNLAAVVVRLGRLAEADSLAAEAGTLYDRLLPQGHPLQAFPLLTRTEIRIREGDGVGAERLARRSVGILEAALPEGHYATAVGRCRIGAALVLQDRGRDAEELVRDALSVLETNRQTPSNMLEECRGTLASLETSVRS